MSERTNRWKRRTYDSVDERQAVTESRKSSISVFKETPDTLTRAKGWDRIRVQRLQTGIGGVRATTALADGPKFGHDIKYLHTYFV